MIGCPGRTQHRSVCTRPCAMPCSTAVSGSVRSWYMPPGKRSTHPTPIWMPRLAQSSSYMPTRWCTMTCPSWTTMICAAASPRVTKPSMRSRPYSPAMRYSLWHSRYSPNIWVTTAQMWSPCWHGLPMPAAHSAWRVDKRWIWPPWVSHSTSRHSRICMYTRLEH